MGTPDATSPVARAIQRLMLRTSRGPLRHLWAALHRLTARAVAVHLLRGSAGGAAYVRGSLAGGEPVWGLADIDLTVVVPPHPGSPGDARRRITARWGRLVRRFAPLGLVLQVTAYEADELPAAARATALTGSRFPSGRLLADEAKLRVRPGLAGATADWRLIGGRELRPREAGHPRHLAAWAELQWWWRLYFEACVDPTRPHVPYLCLKLFTQTSRVRLWLETGTLVSGHSEVLARAAADMPDEEDALRLAASLWRDLPRSPEPPLSEAGGFLFRTTDRAAALLAAEARTAGATEVRLLGSGHSGDGAPGIPLADWRARTPDPLWQGGLVDPLLGDERLLPLADDPADPARLRALALGGAPGARPGIRRGSLLILPAGRYFEWIHRGAQFAASDPVSFALLDDRESAWFPNVSGWSAADCARRAVEGHALWLRYGAQDMEGSNGTAVGLLLGAVRASLFSESVARGEAELAVTLEAAAARLAAERPETRTPLDDGLAAFRAWREGGPPPPGDVVDGLRDLVRGLPTYGRPGAVPETPVADRAGAVVP